MSEKPTTLPLVFDEPRARRKPPRHLADLSAPERRELVTSLGLPGFRARQLSTHYFSRLVDVCSRLLANPTQSRSATCTALVTSPVCAWPLLRRTFLTTRPGCDRN